MDGFIVGIVKRVANRVALDRLHRNGDEIQLAEIMSDHFLPERSETFLRAHHDVVCFEKNHFTA